MLHDGLLLRLKATKSAARQDVGRRDEAPEGFGPTVSLGPIEGLRAHGASHAIPLGRLLPKPKANGN